MKPHLLWGLIALAALIGAGWVWGWAGILLGTVILVIAAAIPALRTYALINAINKTPEGRTVNAAQLHQQIRTSMPLLQIVEKARALGQKISGEPDVYIWQDASQRVQVTFEKQGGTLVAKDIEILPLPPLSISADS